MKASILVAALPLLFGFGCTSRQSEELTQQQKDQVKSEVKAVSDSVIARWVRLDGRGAMDYYAPDVVIEADTMMGFQAYKQGWMAYDSAAAAVKVRPIREDFIALAKNLAVWSWVGNVEVDLKSGDTVTTTPQMYSQVMKKVAHRWMVVFSHASGVDVLHKAAVPHRHKS